MNKSAVENGFKRDAGGPPAIAVAIETEVSTHSDFEDWPAGTARFEDPAGKRPDFERLEEKVAQRT